MRKLLCVFLTAILLIGCCGCDWLNEVQSGIEKTVSQYREHIAGSVFGQRVQTGGKDAVTLDDSDYTDSDFDIGYNCLNGEQKRICRLLYAGAESMTEGWFRLGNCTADYENNLVLAFQALSNDHPEFFWLPFNYLFSNVGSDRNPEIVVAFSYHKDGYSYDYLIRPSQRAQMQQQFETNAQKILNGLPRDLFEAEKYLHDAICKKTVYLERENDPQIYTAYGALVNGTAVCEGYARAMQYLCRRAGILCTVVSGDYENTGHMWNLVCLENEWYHLDTTWDDAKEGIVYSYFNLTDREIREDHEICTEVSDLAGKPENGRFNLFSPACNATKYYYYRYLGRNITREDPETIAWQIVSADRAGENELQFHIADNAYLKSFKNDTQKTVKQVQRLISAYGSFALLYNIMTYGELVTFYWK